MVVLFYKRLSTCNQKYTEQTSLLSQYNLAGQASLVLSEVRPATSYHNSELYFMLKDASRCRSVSTLVVSRLDRIARNIHTGLVFWRMLKQRKIELVVINIPRWSLLSEQQQFILFILTMQIKEDERERSKKGESRESRGSIHNSDWGI
jgi:DNA invertase Pin-like site-specific DNA recombinase